MTITASRRLHQRVLATADRWPSVRVYWLCRNAALLAGFFYFRIQVRGKANLRTPGPVILAPVHRSNLDVPLIAAYCGRRLRSLAKEAMFRGSMGRWFSASIGAFPVQRDRLDRAALETASTLLQRGEPLLVFPEGTRGSGPTVGEVHNGCAYLATTTGTRVIPIGLAGTEDAMPPGAKIPRRRRIVISIGEPIEPLLVGGDSNPVGAPVEPARSEPDAGRGASRTLRRALSARVRGEMQRLLDESRDTLGALPQRRWGRRIPPG